MDAWFSVFNKLPKYRARYILCGSTNMVHEIIRTEELTYPQMLHLVLSSQCCSQGFSTIKTLAAWTYPAFITVRSKGPIITIIFPAARLLSRFSHVRLCATPETAAHQAPPSLGFSKQEHWSGLPFPSPMHESEKWKWSRFSLARLNDKFQRK